MVIMGVYYIDIIGKLIKDDKKAKPQYKGWKASIPFAYWLSPVENKRRNNKKQSNEKK